MSRLQKIVYDDRGAVDLQSTMVTALILAALSGAITLSVFKVIPWVQDVVTQSSLSAVAEAQKIQHIMGGSYVNEATLVASGLITQKDADRVDTRALDKPWDGRIRAGVPTGEHFMVSMVSGTGKNLFMHDDSGSSISEMPAQPSGLMASTWDTSIAPNCREISLPVGDFTGTVNWGDGTTNDQTSHLYSDSAGSTQIAIDGYFTSWGGEAWEDANCLISVDSWGETGTEILENAFENADNLRHVEAIPSTTTNLKRAFYYVDSDFTIGTFDTSNVTTMNGMFQSASKFNRPLPFNTSNTTDISWMFYRANAFNQPLNFDTSKVTTLHAIFGWAAAFNQPLTFDTSNVTDMQFVFYGASAFNQLVPFDTSKTTNMHQMFSNALIFNQPISFDTSNVTDMSAMFYRAYAFNQPLDFDTSHVTTFQTMFSQATIFNQPLRFDTRSATNLSKMFHYASAFNSAIEFTDTSKVVNTSGMFYRAIAFNQSVDFDTSSVTDMSEMFYVATAFNKPVQFNTSQVVTMNQMFRNATAFNQALAFDTAKVTDMISLFHSASKFNQDLSAWTVSQVTPAQRENYAASTPLWTKPKPAWTS